LNLRRLIGEQILVLGPWLALIAGIANIAMAWMDSRVASKEQQIIAVVLAHGGARGTYYTYAFEVGGREYSGDFDRLKADNLGSGSIDGLRVGVYFNPAHPASNSQIEFHAKSIGDIHRALLTFTFGVVLLGLRFVMAAFVTRGSTSTGESNGTAE